MNTTLDREFDVLVVGAGPAGSHLAIRLAAAGHRVALVDRKRFPRAKPCGEFMSPECVRLLDEVGLGDLLGSAAAREVDGMRLHGHGRRVEGRFSPFSREAVQLDHGYALRRELLDLRSFEAAAAAPGVTTLPGHALSDLLRDGHGRVIGATLLDPDQQALRLGARFTVGADGTQSSVARRLGVQRRLRWLDRFAIVARYEGVDQRRHAEVHFLDNAYLAMAPIDGDQLTLNLVFDRAEMPAGRQALQDFLDQHIAAAPELARTLGGRRPVERLMACGPLAMRTTRQVFDGAALVGDACGYVDPVTGEGLYFAIRGAALLAPELDAALRAGRNDAGVLRGYVRARRRVLGPRFAMARLLQRGMKHPSVVRAFLATLQARPRLADLLVTITGDSLSPRALLDPRVLVQALRRPAA